MNFTAEEIRMLAQAEQDMDAGKRPFVVSGGQRMLVDPLVMTEFGLETGQTVSQEITLAILEANLATVRAAIAVSA